MNTLVTYMTVTGNTKKVAEAIYGEIEGRKEIKPIEQVKDLEGYDLIFVGFPVMRFGPPDKIKTFLESNAKGKKVALFVTHAMWTKLEPLKGILMKCREAASCANVVGFFDCQGELSEPVAQSLLTSENPDMQKFGEMRSMTMGHPDAKDLENARAFTRDIMGKVMVRKTE